jgi:hypothetical protein
VGGDEVDLEVIREGEGLWEQWDSCGQPTFRRSYSYLPRGRGFQPMMVERYDYMESAP